MLLLARDVQERDDVKAGVFACCFNVASLRSFAEWKTESLSIAESSKAGDLKRLAQKSFEQGFLRLVTAEGHVLADPNQSLQAAGLQGGDHLTAIVQQAKMAATRRAFAMW